MYDTDAIAIDNQPLSVAVLLLSFMAVPRRAPHFSASACRLAWNIVDPLPSRMRALPGLTLDVTDGYAGWLLSDNYVL